MIFDDWLRRNNDLPPIDVAGGVLIVVVVVVVVVVVDGAADRSDAVDDVVVEPAMNCWCLVVDACCWYCCDLMA